jgi:DMSO/TMAO reductase YedYZ molybdopterin-dependent catalytic subunit
MTRTMRTSRRRFLAAFALGATATLLTACAPVAVPVALEASPVPLVGTAAVAPPTPVARAAAMATPPTPVASATTMSPGAASPCRLAPDAVPTPAPYPGYARQDESTGLHVTSEGRLLDLDSYRLKVSGKVEKTLELLYDELRCLPRVESSLDLSCPGVFLDHATFAGTPIAEVLALAGVRPEAEWVRFVADGNYTILLPLADALDRANFLCYELNRQPLPPMHGFPLRLVIPGAPGGRWAKWVLEVIVG